MKAVKRGTPEEPQTPLNGAFGEGPEGPRLPSFPSVSINGELAFRLQIAGIFFGDLAVHPFFVP
jgi:hypothetical protein